MWKTKLRMIWAILTCKKVSVYALHNTCGVIYETTVENTKAACNMACDMCMYAKHVIIEHLVFLKNIVRTI